MQWCFLNRCATLGVAEWWSAAWTGSAMVRYALAAAVGSLVLSFLGRVLWRTRRRDVVAQPCSLAALPRRVWARLNDEGGVATIEFALVLPTAMFIFLILLQTVLMMSAQVFVHYAAYAATRAAIVVLPDGREGGGGEMTADEESPENQQIQRAAAFAVTPICGRLTDTSGDPSRFAGDLGGVFEAYGQDTPKWVSTFAAGRMAYALRHTDVRLMETTVNSEGAVNFYPVNGANPSVRLRPKDPVTVLVSHRLHLSVPYASALFSDGKHDTLGGSTAYANVRAHCTMTLEGYDRSMPPEPEVERSP